MAKRPTNPFEAQRVNDDMWHLFLDDPGGFSFVGYVARCDGGWRTEDQRIPRATPCMAADDQWGRPAGDAILFHPDYKA